eukprot:15366265-Ditylum_brightwellii.AAC.2
MNSSSGQNDKRKNPPSRSFTRRRRTRTAPYMVTSLSTNCDMFCNGMLGHATSLGNSPMFMGLTCAINSDEYMVLPMKGWSRHWLAIVRR